MLSEEKEETRKNEIKIDENFEIQLPKQLIEHLDLNENDCLIVECIGDNAIISKKN